MKKQVKNIVRKYLIKNNIPLTHSVKKWCTVTCIVDGPKAAGAGQSANRDLKNKYFKDKPPYITIWTYILSMQNLKYCSHGDHVENIFKFNKNTSNKDGLSYNCSNCHNKISKKWVDSNKEQHKQTVKNWTTRNKGKRNAITRRYQATKLQRTPKWADQEAISFFYECCPKDCHVDHIIPLQGKKISGLHIETNLQWLPATENLRKSNKWTELV